MWRSLSSRGAVYRRFCASASPPGGNGASGGVRARGRPARDPEVSKRANAGILGFIDAGGGAGATQTGRAWRTAELRLKSFDDLHRLWFVLLRERNVLLTEKEWCRSNGRHWVRGESNLYKVKRSMARLKGVIGERSRAYKAKKEREAKEAADEDPGLADVESAATSVPGATTRV